MAIQLSLFLDIATQFIDCKSSQQLWNNSKEFAGAENKAKVLWYMGEFQRTRKGQTKMEDYLNNMKQIADNLKLAGSPLPLSDLFFQILAGLDSDYTLVVMTLLDKQDLT